MDHVLMEVWFRSFSFLNGWFVGSSRYSSRAVSSNLTVCIDLPGTNRIFFLPGFPLACGMPARPCLSSFCFFLQTKHHCEGHRTMLWTSEMDQHCNQQKWVLWRVQAMERIKKKQVHITMKGGVAYQKSRKSTARQVGGADTFGCHYGCTSSYVRILWIDQIATEEWSF